MAVINRYEFISDIYMFLPSDNNLDTEELVVLLDNVILNVVGEDDDSRYCDVLYSFLNYFADFNEAKDTVDLYGLSSDQVDMRSQRYSNNNEGRWNRYKSKSIPMLMKLKGCPLPETTVVSSSYGKIHPGTRPDPFATKAYTS